MADQLTVGPALDRWSFNQGVIYAACRLVELFDQPGNAADICVEAGLTAQYLVIHADTYDQRFVKQITANMGGRRCKK